MEKEQQGELITLQEEAMRILRRGSTRPNYTRELHLVVLPSFQDCRSYELFLPRPGADLTAVAVRMVWKKDVDLAKFASPVVRLTHGIGAPLSPTFEQAEITTVSKDIDRLLNAATTIRVSARVHTSVFGLDGTLYEISFGGFVFAQFRWWNIAPAGWEPLQEIVQEIETLMSHHS
jgi:hypothetical protein